MMEEPLPVNALGELHLAAKKEILCAFSGNLVKRNSWAASLCYVLMHGELPALATEITHQNFPRSPQDAYCSWPLEQEPLTVQNHTYSEIRVQLNSLRFNRDGAI